MLTHRSIVVVLLYDCFGKYSAFHSDRSRWQLEAVAGGGSGGDIGGGNAGGGGGGGDAWGSGGNDESSSRKEESILWKGWNDRVAADPQFTYKVFIEQVIGVGASVLGDMASRPNWGLNELDFVFATLVVGSIVNFSLMYLLAPTASAAAAGASTGLISRIFSEQILTSWGAPGGHMFQSGFPLAKRALNFAYKGGIFAFIGMCAGLMGTTISNGLLLARKKMDPDFVIQNEPPSIVGNASCWALHMGVSSNLRYQLLNGMDMVLQPRMPSGAFRAFTSVVRGVNNAIGGISFVTIAKLFGVQKSAEPAPVPVVDPKNKKKGAGKKGK